MSLEHLPSRGERIALYDRSAGQYDGTAEVAAVMNRGIHGWIVELPSLLLVEVVASDGPTPWKEFPRAPIVAGGKDKGSK